MTQKQKKTQVKSAALSMLIVAVMLLVTLVPAATVNAETKEVGGNLTVAVKEAPGTTNPLNATQDEWIMNALYDSLAIYDPVKGVLPWLASSWTVGEGNTTVTVTLKNGVTFTDGSPMTSADVVYSYEQYMGSTGYYGNSVACIQGVSASDDMTVVFTLSAPNSNFFTMGLMVPIIKDGTANKPIGTGPFMDYTTGSRTGTDTNITLNDPNDAGSRVGGDVTFHLPHSHLIEGSVVVHCYAPIMDNGSFIGTDWSTENNHTIDYDYVAGTVTINGLNEFEYVTVDFSFEQDTFSVSTNTNYFAGRPYVDGITFVMEYGMDSASVDDINNQRVDVIFDMVDPYYKSVVQGMNSLTPLTTDTIELRINSGNAPLDNSEFRKAVSYAVDKQGFVTKTLMNSGIVADSVIPRDNVFWYNTTLAARPYDTGLASSTLSNAGYVDSDGNGYVDLPDGTPFSITVKSVGIDVDNYLAAQAQVISEILKNEVGVNNTWVVESSENITADMNSGNFDLIMVRMRYPLDPSYLETFMTGNAGNVMGYSNASFDAVMEKASSEMDLSKKQMYIKQAQGILYDDTATIVLAYLKGLQYYNGNTYEGYYNIINGINNKMSLLNVYHVIEGSLSTSVVVSTYSPVSGHDVTITFTVTDGTNPIESAEIELSASAGTLSSATVTTDADGKATVTVTTPEVTEFTDVTITAKAYKPGYIHSENSITVTVHPVEQDMLSVAVDPTSAEVGSGNSTTLTVTVTATDGNPVEGATIDVTVLPSTGATVSVSGPTDENGQATITFTAPETTSRIIHTLQITAHADGYTDPDSPAVSTITVVGKAPASPEVTADSVPGFEAFVAMAAIAMAGVAFGLRKKD